MASRLPEFISLEDFKKILKAERSREFKLAYVLAFGSGLRLSEILGPAPNSSQEIRPLTKEQIDLKAHQIRLIGKGNKERITVTSPWLNESNIKLLPLNIQRRTLQRRFGKLCERVLGRELSFHSLRHGFANYLANEKGMPLPYVQSLLGHSRLDTTGIYTRANPKQAIEKAWEVF